MGPRSSVVLGLLLGLVVAAAIFVGIVALAPEAGGTATPAPSLALSPSPSPVASAGPTSSGSPGGSTSAAASPGGQSLVGRPAPSLRVEQLGGGTVDLAALRGKPVWVAFVGTGCTACRDELQRMADYANRYAETGLVVVAVDTGEDEAVVAPSMESLGVTFPVGLDPNGSALAAWNGATLPAHYWVDASGVVRAAASGGLGPDGMSASLETILPGVDVTP